MSTDIREEARAAVHNARPPWHDNGVGIVQGSHYRSGFVDGAVWADARLGGAEPQVEVTEDMMVRAMRAGALSAQFADSEEWMREVLSAALGGGTND